MVEDDAGSSNQMLQDFACIRVAQQASAEQMKKLKQMLKLKEEELAFVKSNLADMRQGGMEKVNMIGNIGDLVGEIPKYKKRISELSQSVDESQRATQGKLEEISRVQQKQDRDNAMVEERIEGERVKERAQEESNIEELEKLLRGAQEIDIENAERRMEREKQKVDEKGRILEEEIKLMREKHGRKIQTLNNQLLEAKKASDETKVFSMEVVRKDMELMKQEYEGRIGDLAKLIAAFKERKAGQAAAAKKKKVSFDLPCDDSSSTSENRDERKAFGFIGDLGRRVACESLSNTNTSTSWGGGATLGTGDCPVSWDSTVPRRPFTHTASRCGRLSEAGAEATLHHKKPFKFMARPAGNFSHGITSDFCTFASQRVVGILHF